MSKVNEIWLPITGYEGLYEISNYGSVKSLARLKNNGGLYKEKILKNIKSHGYNLVALCKDSKPKMIRVHRIIGEHFIPNPENKPTINHINGIREDNRIENLEWATHKENSVHASNTGLMQFGESHHRAKLKNLDIPIILEMIKSGIDYKIIANLYNVSFACIWDIYKGRKWKKLTKITPSVG